MNIKSMCVKERPRERLSKVGSASLSTAELLAIILKFGTKEKSVLEIAHNLLASNLHQLSRLSLQELKNLHGIGQAKACQIIALFEIAQRFTKESNDNKVIRDAKDIADIYIPKMRNLQKEQFIGIFLDTKNKIISDSIISIGTINSSVVHPREVFHSAVKAMANSIIVLHNHPSGDPSPSKEDISVTKILKISGETMGIPLLDHIIIGNDNWWSWNEDCVAQI